MREPHSTLAGWERFNRRLSKWFEYIAIAGVLGMILATTVDVVGAKVFGWPLPAGTEIVYLLQVIAIAGAIAISQMDGRHVRIENIDRLPRPWRAIFSAIVHFLSLALFGVLMWKSAEFALSLRANNEVTATARIIVYPFAFWLAAGCVPMVLVLLKSLVGSLLEAGKK